MNKVNKATRPVVSFLAALLSASAVLSLKAKSEVEDGVQKVVERDQKVGVRLKPGFQGNISQMFSLLWVNI